MKDRGSVNVFNIDSKVVRSSQQVSCDLSGEAAILNIKDGIYYGLDTVGAIVWKLIEHPVRLAEIRDVLMEEYDVQCERCEDDLLKLLQELVAKGLVEVVEDGQASTLPPHVA